VPLASATPPPFATTLWAFAFARTINNPLLVAKLRGELKDLGCFAGIGRLFSTGGGFRMGWK
jgi:hypothetical protein